MPTTMKTCPQCGTEYAATLEFFYKFKAPDGLYPRCKTCYKAGRGTKPRGTSSVAFVARRQPGSRRSGRPRSRARRRMS